MRPGDLSPCDGRRKKVCLSQTRICTFSHETYHGGLIVLLASIHRDTYSTRRRVDSRPVSPCSSALFVRGSGWHHVDRVSWRPLLSVLSSSSCIENDCTDGVTTNVCIVSSKSRNKARPCTSLWYSAEGRERDRSETVFNMIRRRAGCDDPIAIYRYEKVTSAPVVEVQSTRKSQLHKTSDIQWGPCLERTALSTLRLASVEGRGRSHGGALSID